jgi:putative ABC transport system permease protein
MGLFSVSLRIFLRDLARGDLNTLIGAVMIAVSAIATTGILANRLDRTVNEEAGEILGADLVIRGRSEIPRDWRESATRMGLQHIESIEFSTMLLEGDATLLVGVKTVEDGYPLRGDLISEDVKGLRVKGAKILPQPGEAWVDHPVLRRLNLSVGDLITVGEKKLKVTRILIHEPDRRGDMNGLSPRVLMNRSDLDATQVIQPGSQIAHIELLRGEAQKIRAFRSLIKPQLRPEQKLNDLEEDRPELGKTIQRTRQFMSFLSLAVILLAGVAIALSTQDYVRRHTEMVALLRCLGSSDRHILALLLIQLVSIGLLGSFLGILVGLMAETILIEALGELLPGHIAVPWAAAWTLSIGLGNAILMIFALPPILDLRKMPTLGILQGNAMPFPSRRFLSYAMGLFLILGTLLWHTGSIKMMVSTLAIGAAALAVLALGAYFLLLALRRMSEPFPFAIRLGIRRLFRHPSRTLIQLVGFSLTFAALTLVTTLREDLIDDWMAHLPPNAPNYFVINLFDHELSNFEATVSETAPQPIELYPVIRGRLTHINGEEALKIASQDSRAEGSINRDLALTYTTKLPPDNRIVEGTWAPEEHEEDLSIEEGLAKRLRIKVGDLLEFNILGEVIHGRVGSIRSVHWDRLTPNFFFIFPKKLLESHPRTWMTSLHIANQEIRLERTLVERFPSISLIEIGRLVEQVQMIANQISQSMLPLIGLCLISGLFAVWSGVHATRQERDQEDRLLRIFGTERKRIRLTNATEFVALGLISGLFGAVTAETIRWALYATALEIPFSLRMELILGMPQVGALALLSIGLWASRAKS